MCNRRGSCNRKWFVFLKQLNAYLIFFFSEHIKNVANKLKEHSMTKPFPWIGGNLTREAKNQTSFNLRLGVCEQTIGKRLFYFCLGPIINFNLRNPTYPHSLINDACYQLCLRGNGQCWILSVCNTAEKKIQLYLFVMDCQQTRD